MLTLLFDGIAYGMLLFVLAVGLAVTLGLIQEKDASHFNYFANPRSAEAAVRALLETTPAGFLPIGPLSMAGQSSTGSR